MHFSSRIQFLHVSIFSNNPIFENIWYPGYLPGFIYICIYVRVPYGIPHVVYVSQPLLLSLLEEHNNNPPLIISSPSRSFTHLPHTPQTRPKVQYMLYFFLFPRPSGRDWTTPPPRLECCILVARHHKCHQERSNITIVCRTRHFHSVRTTMNLCIFPSLLASDSVLGVFLSS